MKRLTPTRVRALLDYRPSTGQFTWKVDRGGSIKAGDPAGTLDKDGYVRITVDYRKRRANRLAWMHYYGRSPRGVIDHKNRERSDNRIRNLRDVTRAVNCQNLGGPLKNNQTGLLGVSPYRGQFRAHIWIGGRQRLLGVFGTAREAHTVYMAAKRRHHAGCTI